VDVGLDDDCARTARPKLAGGGKHAVAVLRAGHGAGGGALRLAVVRPDLALALIPVRPARDVQAAPPNMEPNAEVGGLLTRLGRLDFPTLPGTAIGVKGQGLDPFATARLIEAAGLIDASGRRIVLAADGGIRDPTVPLLHAAGAETVVPGRSASVRRTWANGCAGCRGQRRRGVRDAGWIFVRMRRGRQPGNRARAPETGRF
jgi:hypothetical protein